MCLASLYLDLSAFPKWLSGAGSPEAILAVGWFSPGFEDCSRFLNKLLKEESSVVSSLLVEAVATDHPGLLASYTNRKKRGLLKA